MTNNGASGEVDVNGHAGQDQQTNGTGTTPGMSDLLLSFGEGRPDHVKAMMTTSTDPAEYIPRSRISEKDAKRNLRILAKRAILFAHEAPTELLLWYSAAYSIAIDGKGREEAVQIIIGERAAIARRGMGGAFRTFDKGQIQA